MRRFMKGEISESEYWDELRSHYGLTIPDTISDEFKKWRGLIKNDDIYALIGQAKARGFKTAMFSNIIEPTYNVLQKVGYLDDFDEIIASFKVGLAKPQKEIYELALKQLNTTPEQSVFIDDKQKNLNPAIEMGFKPYWPKIQNRLFVIYEAIFKVSLVKTS